MKTNLNIILLAFIAASISLHAGTTPFPAPLPQFMNKEQMAKWNAERDAAAAKTVSSSQETPTQFYTGKPYVADAGGYIFKYRTYNPEMSRWTSADPSGFPDEANNTLYSRAPSFELDSDGLVTLAVTDDGNGSPANNGNNTFTWTWSISYNGTVVLSGGSSQTATANSVNQSILNNTVNYGAITVPNAQVGTAYTFDFYAPGTVSYQSTPETFNTSATASGPSNNYGTWVNTGWSLTALAFDSTGVSSYTALNNESNDAVNNGVKLLSNSNFGGGIDSYLVTQLVSAGFATASSDSDKFYVGGGSGSYNE